MKLNTLTRSILAGSALGLSLTSANVTAATDQNDVKIKQLEEQINLLADQIESSTSGSSSTTIGGYGELHYNNYNTASGKSDKIDFHRFVLFFNHEFNDKIRFFSEFELEHALAGGGDSHGAGEADSGGKPGEVELEQAYIEFDVSKNGQMKAGVFLMPVGILNETHEPDTFYGVERNPVEKNIVPTTWWEAGGMYSAQAASGLSYDIAAHSGLNTDSGSNYKPRSGRQKVANAVAEDMAMTARIKFTGVNGLELAATTQYQNDITQGQDITAGAAQLIEAHAIWSQGAIKIIALTSQWSLDGTGPAAMGADKQTGSYLEASYKVTPKLGVFTRFNQWDNKAGSISDTSEKQTDFGVNYWAHEKVVFKVDIAKYRNTANAAKDYDAVNIGLGYSF